MCNVIMIISSIILVINKVYILNHSVFPSSLCIPDEEYAAIYGASEEDTGGASSTTTLMILVGVIALLVFLLTTILTCMYRRLKLKQRGMGRPGQRHTKRIIIMQEVR